MGLYITTLAEMKGILGVPDTQDDAELTIVMEGVQARIDGYLNRILLSGTESQICDGGGNRIYLRRWPVETVTQIVVDADQDWTNSDGELDLDDDVLINYQRGYVLYSRGDVAWPTGKLSVRVTYTGGLFSADNDGTAANDNCKANDVAMVRRAMMMQVNFEWRNKKSLGLSGVNKDGNSINFGNPASLAGRGMTLIPEVEQTLMPLRRVV